MRSPLPEGEKPYHAISRLSNLWMFLYNGELDRIEMAPHLVTNAPEE
jgi:hypothetical protein